jgi:type I restriction enzyme S subunit
VALYGQGKTRGKAAVLGIEAATNQACGVLQPNEKYETPFLFQQLRLSYQRLRDLGRGGNQENLNLGLLSNFTVLLPPLELQQEFARRVAAIEKLMRVQRTSLAELDALFASLQQRAFRGEL